MSHSDTPFASFCDASSFATYAQSFERFAAAARQFIDAAAKPSVSAAEATRAFTTTLREQSMDFFRPAWSSASGSSGATPWPTMADNPALGPTREHQLRAQRMADAAVRISEAQRRLQTLCSDALRDASLSFIETLESFGPLINGANTQSTERLGLDALLRLYNSWIECAEEAYARTAHSESFCTAMADFVNSNSQWRVEFRSAWEHWSHMLDLPTRSELNSLARLLKSTEEQLRAKRPIRTQRNEPAGPAKRPRKS